NWFRPVALTLGPDGAIYVLDFYREVIETPLSLPADIKRRVVLSSRGRGRIWRITTAKEGTKPPKVALDKAAERELVNYLASDNAWVRLTAQRLLQHGKIVPREGLLEKPTPLAKMHLLWARAKQGAPVRSILVRYLNSSDAGLRAQAVRLAA